MLLIKEMNDWVKYVADDQVEQYNTLLGSIGKPQGFSSKKDSNANINAGLDLEFRFFSSKNWGLGLGTGFNIAKGKYDVTSPYYSDKIECTASLMTIPLAATLYYVAPLSEKSFFTVGGGVAYYFAFMDMEGMNNEPTPPSIDEPSFLGDTTALGYHIKADYTYLIGALSLTGGIRAKYVKFKEFEDGGIKRKVDAGLTGINLYLGIGFAI